ncbi:MAG: hypothetical protein IT210_18325 [Armatimonadetes bacterium]|nr:hypothetical protein [Armatimonadota bacterium]
MKALRWALLVCLTSLLMLRAEPISGQDSLLRLLERETTQILKGAMPSVVALRAFGTRDLAGWMPGSLPQNSLYRRLLGKAQDVQLRNRLLRLETRQNEIEKRSAGKNPAVREIAKQIEAPCVRAQPPPRRRWARRD